MAWFWNSEKKEKHEIHSITRLGKLPIYEITFKGKGPYGGKEFKIVNLLYDNDTIKKDMYSGSLRKTLILL